MGAPKRWARDFAVIGGVTGLAAPLALGSGFISGGFIATAAVSGVISGALLGAAVPRGLARLGNVRLPLLMFGGVGLGAIWGALVGTSASLITGDGFLWFSAILAGIAGSIQFGWVWLPYVLKQINRKKTWPLVMGALIVSPALGWAALWVFAMLSSLFSFL